MEQAIFILGVKPVDYKKDGGKGEQVTGTEIHYTFAAPEGDPKKGRGHQCQQEFLRNYVADSKQFPNVPGVYMAKFGMRRGVKNQMVAFIESVTAKGGLLLTPESGK